MKYSIVFSHRSMNLNLIKRGSSALVFFLLLIPGILFSQSRANLVNQPYPDSLLSRSPSSTISVTVLNSGITPEQLVQLLLGPGISFSNVTYTGANVACGKFMNGIAAGLNMNSGVILSSGTINNAIGPNNSSGTSAVNGTPGDPDLSLLIGQTTNDAAVLEFDFIPASNSISFQYVMGSDEYPEFINYSDVFGFFLNYQNIAFIPGTTIPVSISSVNNLTNSQFYVSNTPAPQAPHDIECDGYTTVLEAFAYVIPGQTYHIKLAVADYQDAEVDTWVFLQEGSFTSGSDIQVKVYPPNNPLVNSPGIYHVSIKNNGPSTADTVNAIFRPCEQVTYTSSTTTKGTTSFNNGRLNCNIGSLANDDSVWISITVQVNEVPLGISVARATSNIYDPNLINNNDPIYHSPIATNDYYELLEDNQLVKNHKYGVLSNDSVVSVYVETVELISNVSHGTLVLNQDGSFSYMPVLNFAGTDQFTYRISDQISYSGTATVTFNVSQVNDPPTINNVTVSPLLEDVGQFTIPLSGIGDGDSEVAQDLALTVTSSNPAIIPEPIISYVPNNTTGSLMVQSIPNLSGNSTISLTVTDNGGTANGGLNTKTIQFVIQVLPVNDPPTLNPIQDPLPILEDASQQTILLSGIADGDPDIIQNITISAVSSNVSIIPNPTISYIPNSPTGSLSYTPLPNANGSITITVTVNDNGGTDNGGFNIIQKSFIVNIIPVNDAPVANAGPDQTVYSGVQVSLNGSGSYDVDGDPISYSWTTPPGITLSNPTSPNPTFTIPISCASQSFTFSLVVNDPYTNSSTDFCSVIAASAQPNIHVTPVSYNENLLVGSSLVKVLKIRNDGSCNVTLSLLSQAVWLMPASTNYLINIGDSIEVNVLFSASSLNSGIYNSSLKIFCFDPVNPAVTIPVTLNVYNQINVTANAVPSQICLGSSSQLHSIASGGLGPYSYNWTSNPPGFVSSIQDPIVNPTVNTTYQVVATDGYGYDTATVSVAVNQTQTPGGITNMLPANNSFGLPLPITFSWAPASNATFYDLYIWHSNQPQPIAPIGLNLTQISYTYTGGSLTSGDTCKWLVIAKNQCFQTSGPIQIFSIKGLPELHVTGVTNSTPMTGIPLTVSWTVKNTGEGATPPGAVWYDRVWLSPDLDVRIGEPEDILLGQFPNLSALGVNEPYTQTQQIQIPQNVIGNYFLFVITDALDALFINWPPTGPPLPYTPPPYYTAYSHGGSFVNVVPEISDNPPWHDNFFYKEISFLVPPLPDLIVTSIIPSANLFSGRSSHIAWTVKNDGDGNTGTNSWSDRVYLSPDTAFNSSTAIDIGTFNHAGILNKDSTYTVADSVTIPPNIFGTYYFFVKTDVNNTVFEHVYENNNMSHSTSVNIVLLPPPDLVVKQIFAPDTLSNTDIVNVRWKVKNEGATTPYVTSWNDAVYLSISPDYDLMNSFLLGSATINKRLYPDSSYTMLKSFNLSQNISGPYYIYVSTDFNNNVFEYNKENNNVLKRDTAIEIINPDLIVSGLTIPSINNNSQPFTINWSIKNNGPGAIKNKNWTDRIMISKSPIYHSDSVISVDSLSYSVLSLLRNETINKQKVLYLPDNVSGTWYFYILTDCSNTVFEKLNEDNNTIRSTNTIAILKPDLMTKSVIIPAIDSTGQLVDIYWKVKNTGQGIVENRNWTDRIMVSSAPVYNPNSVIPLAILNYDGYLFPGDSISRGISLSLSDSIPGPYYIYIKTDCFDVIYENQSEANNVARSPDLVQIFRPDLIVQDVIVPNSASSGESMNVNWKTKNNGMASILNKNWIDRVMISPQAIYNPNSVTLLGNKLLSRSLPAGDTISNQMMVNIPEGISGSYYVHVFTDFRDTIDENIHENNNVTSVPLHLEISSWADLHITGITLQNLAVAGNNIPLSFIVKNSGTRAIHQKTWSDKVFISSEPVWNQGAATFLREFQQSVNLEIDSIYLNNTSVNLPAGLANGNYYIYVFTDADNSIFEYTSENNNIRRSDPIFINAIPPVDLKVISVTNPNLAMSGQPITIEWSIKNIGNSNTVPNWDDAVYLSLDSIWDKNSDIFIGKRLHYGQLAPGESYNCSQSFTLPNGISGDYYLIAVTDYNKVNNDVDLLNNYHSKVNGANTRQKTHIDLTPPPDLKVPSFIVPEQATTGSPFTLRWTVKNEGIGSTLIDSWIDKIYLSTDYTINSGDLLIGTKTHSGALEMEQFYNDSIQVTIPNTYSGNYILLIKTDISNVVYEIDESNNLNNSLIVLSQPPPADLYVSEINHPAIVIVGKSATIQWTLKNIVQNQVNGTVKDLVYFSDDPFWDVNDKLFGSYQSNLNLTPGQEITRNLTAAVNDLTTGYYYIIVKTDVLNGIYESDETNNSTTSNETVLADVKLLSLNVLTSDTLKDFENLYFRIPIHDSLFSETLLTTLKGDSLYGSNEMYQKSNGMPTRINYDYSHTNPYHGNQEIVVPNVINGNYYMLLFGNTMPGDQQAITVKPEILNFGIRSVDPVSGGNTGQVTLKISGSKFFPMTEIKLQNGQDTVQAKIIHYVDRSLLFATFDLRGIQPTIFDVFAKNITGEIVIIHNGFEVQSGLPQKLSVYVTAPPNARPNRVTSFAIEYANLGNTDILNPHVTVKSLTGAPIALSVDDLKQMKTELLVSLDEINSPPNILRPGVMGTITIFTKTTAGLGFLIKY